jgi:hypothetical protein
MRIIVGCEKSQVICIAFRKKGHEAYSCDLEPCSGGHPEWHLQMDVLDAINLSKMKIKWDMMIAHPPCTYLSVTANKWLKDQPARKSGALVGEARRQARREAIIFFKKLADSKIDKIGLENPVGIMSTEYRKPDQIIQPFQFGHPEPKKTCLWLKNLPLLIPTKIVEPEYFISKSGKRLASWYYKPSPSPERQTMRSVTFPGIAEAMAEQWNF